MRIIRPRGEVLLRVERAAFGYGEGPVISNVDVVVRAADFIGIVGPNGGGKTTLFRGMLGLIRPRAGIVGRSTGAVGYVPQRETLDAIYPLTVREVVEMGAYGRVGGWRRLPRVERDRATSLLESVDMRERADATFASLSGGQRQRTLIARALMNEPRLLLLDEPTSGVDRRAEALIKDLLAELNRRGLAILLVSHQLGLLRKAAHRVLWVGDGSVKILEADDLPELGLPGDFAPRAPRAPRAPGGA
jgi:ABC-type Mn2+/Zn2+ transport system ATPase subunit